MNPVQVLDEPAFSGLVQAHRHELRVHCYRMVGSFSDSEDLVQEALLRAWRKRDTFQGDRPRGPGSTASRPTCASTSSTASSAGRAPGA
nr:hypothetical protein GCM10020093_068800 [Planobispora longispora]